MPVNLFVRISAGTNAFTSVARSGSPGATCSFYFQPNLTARARAAIQPARFSSLDVVHARYATALALIFIRNRYPAARQIQALHLLLLQAALKAGRQPALARQTQATKQAAPAQKAASKVESDTVFRSRGQSGGTSYSAEAPRSDAKPKTRTSSSGAKRAERRQEADAPKPTYTAKPRKPEPKTRPSNSGAESAYQRQSADKPNRANTEKPESAAAPSNPVASAFEVMGLPVTATLAEVKKAYHKAALQHHPDKGGDAEKFKALSNAYEKVKLHFESLGS